MKKKKQISEMNFTYGHPVMVSGLFVIVFILLSLTTFDYMIWTITTYILALPIYLPMIIFGIGSVIKYINRARYLHKYKRTIPKSYALIFITSLLAILSPFLTYMMATSTVSAKMNTMNEFKVAAQNCRIDKVLGYNNGAYHRSADSGAYIAVYLSTNSKQLYYSYSQKDEIKAIFSTNAKQCAPTPSDTYGFEAPILDVDSVRSEAW